MHTKPSDITTQKLFVTPQYRSIGIEAFRKMQPNREKRNWLTPSSAKQ
jgi:hypothetical protein